MNDPTSIDINMVLAQMRDTIGQLHQDLAIARAANDVLQTQLEGATNVIPSEPLPNPDMGGGPDR